MRFLDVPISQPDFFDPESAWLRHGPFGMWLVGALRPDRIVELGTHNGYSYFSFCQAVRDHGLPTRCVAVDTWDGDEHAGLFDASVHEGIVARNATYAGFSRLLRKTFADARADIADGSVDLLHVDGRHFYDDVKGDFEGWIPKLSSRAVVLFHDTEVRERGFGVYRYWAEIAGTRPSVNLPHENGLGVLFWGPQTDGAITQLVQLLQTDEGEKAVIATFDLAGELYMQAYFHAQAQLRAAQDIAEHQRRGARLLAEKDSEHQGREARLIAEIDAEHEKVQQARARVSAAERSIRQLQEEAAANHSVITRLEDELRRARGKPLSLLGPLIEFKLLHGLSNIGAVPMHTRQRFSRSAAKRDPKRRMGSVTFASTDLLELSDTSTPLSMEDIKRQMKTAAAARLDEFLAGSGRIVFSPAPAPSITVILVLWNQSAMTLACLDALLLEAEMPLDVIIVDNASTDQTADLLSRVQGARVLTQADNLGFLRAVNLALAEVRGGHVLLLNNDATLRPGTLSAAVAAMASAPDVGAVGGPIVLPDGSLQEAGSIIWNDGSCQGYGRQDDPARGVYMFRRTVDYCSGAFLMIREGVFQKLGGFDDAYAPAYYEETDLCMRLRTAGYRVLYDPQVVIDHYEFGSSEKVGDALDLQRRNRETFCARHARALAEDHLPPGADNVLEGRMRDARPRLLYLDDRVPFRDAGAGLPRAHDILHLMAADHFVTFLPTTTPTDPWADTFAAVPDGVEVAMGVGLVGLEAFLEARTGYYGQIFVSRPHNMARLASIADRRPGLLAATRVIYDAEAIFASRDIVKADLMEDAVLRQKAEAAEQAELALASRAQHVTAVTEAEAARFRHPGGPTVSVLGHAMRPAPTPAEFADRPHLLFLGNLADENSPNTESFVWFVDQVMPHLGPVFDGLTRFLVAGRNDAASVQARRSVRTDLLGPVADLPALFNRARVFVAPTRYAAGIPHKVHQAAALGVPVVATSLLARQLGWQNDEHLLVADTPDEFAKAVTRLHGNAKLWAKIRAGALGRVAQDCDPAVFAAALRGALDTAPPVW